MAIGVVAIVRCGHSQVLWPESDVVAIVMCCGQSGVVASQALWP